MQNLKKILKNIPAEIERAGSWEALILEERIRALSNNSKLEANQDVFLEVCKYSLNALKDYQFNLAESPAAPALLGYLQSAFQIYLSRIEAAKSRVETADRREFLADAFRLSGKSGRKISIEKRIKICNAYSYTLHKLRLAHGGKPTESDLTVAARVALKVHYKKEWIGDDDASKKRMSVIRAILKEEGYAVSADKG